MGDCDSDANTSSKGVPGELAQVGKPDGEPTQIIDGGYFENEGLQTALELARWLRSLHVTNDKNGVDPIIIEATADADEYDGSKKIATCNSTFQDTDDDSWRWSKAGSTACSDQWH